MDWNSVEDFIGDTLQNFDQIWRQKSNGRLLLIKRSKSNQVAIVELQQEGNFYGLTTAFPERPNKNFSKTADLLWEK